MLPVGVAAHHGGQHVLLVMHERHQCALARPDRDGVLVHRHLRTVTEHDAAGPAAPRHRLDLPCVPGHLGAHVLGGVVGTAIAVFFFPEPPEVPSINETFRTLPEEALDELPSRMRILLRKAKAMQLNLADLTDGRNPAERMITRDLAFPANVDIAEMAAGVMPPMRDAWPSVRGCTRERRWRASVVRPWTALKPSVSGSCCDSIC